MIEITDINKNLHWLITGGCGFIGTSLVAHLLRINPESQIRILDNLSVGKREDLIEAIRFAGDNLDTNSLNIELIEGDIRDYSACLKCCRDIDVVIHLAANTGVAPSIENPKDDMETNINGTLNMLEASRHNNVKKFIFASSGAAIGKAEPPIHEEMSPRPVSPYGASKLAGEAYCSAYYNTFGINTVSLRFGNVYGPFSKHKNSVIAKFFKLALSGQPLEIYGDGNQTRDFIYIDDLINAILLSVKSDFGGETFQIATYKETTVNEVALKIKEIVENNSMRRVSIINTTPRLGDVRRSYSDISKARKMLGFEPKYTLDEGLRKTYDYFISKINL
jgi:UDP-glucose 4-epimerase